MNVSNLVCIGDGTNLNYENFEGFFPLLHMYVEDFNSNQYITVRQSF
jgi:hypothetical protein